MNKKENNIILNFFNDVGEYIKLHYPVILLVIVGYILFSTINFFNMTLSQTVFSYHIEDFEKANDYGFSFDYYNVFNSKQYIVQKPAYYLLANEALGILFAFIGATGLFLTFIFSAIKRFKKIPFDKNNIGKKAKIFSGYFKIFSAVSLFYTIFNIAVSLLSEFSLSLGIMPLAALLIISLVFDDLIEKKFNDDERKLCGIWRHYSILAFFVAFIGCVLISL